MNTSKIGPNVVKVALHGHWAVAYFVDANHCYVGTALASVSLMGKDAVGLITVRLAKQGLKAVNVYDGRIWL